MVLYLWTLIRKYYKEYNDLANEFTFMNKYLAFIATKFFTFLFFILMEGPFKIKFGWKI